VLNKLCRAPQQQPRRRRLLFAFLGTRSRARYAFPLFHSRVLEADQIIGRKHDAAPFFHSRVFEVDQHIDRKHFVDPFFHPRVFEAGHRSRTPIVAGTRWCASLLLFVHSSIGFDSRYICLASVCHCGAIIILQPGVSGGRQSSVSAKRGFQPTGFFPPPPALRRTAAFATVGSNKVSRAACFLRSRNLVHPAARNQRRT